METAGFQSTLANQTWSDFPLDEMDVDLHHYCVMYIDSLYFIK
jgi:hypothetical protein